LRQRPAAELLLPGEPDILMLPHVFYDLLENEVIIGRPPKWQCSVSTKSDIGSFSRR
jgi:hypothetical protein